MKLLKRLPAIFALVFFVSMGTVSCTTTPMTGRTQLIVLSKEQEIALGVESYAQALEGAKISTDQALIRRVNRIGMRLVEAAGVGDLDWEFTVVDDDSVVNAWALPGGKVAVYTGIIKLAGDDDALLATVMGHEISHVTNRHGAERITRQLGINLLGTAIQASMTDREPETVNAVMMGFGVTSQLVGVLPFGRKQESEADHDGLVHMARAGYHPKKAIEFWQRMSELSGDSGFEFLSTHPSHDTRVENLEKWQEEALAVFRPGE